MFASTPSPRERLVEVASRLFYSEGIHAVGVDRVIAEAGVAKATLYAHFPSKDQLVAAYLERQSAGWAEAVERRAAKSGTSPTARVRVPFEVLAERASSPSYRGCPFINAAAEFPEPGPVASAIARHRRVVKNTFRDLLGRAAEDSGLLDVIVALYDGAMTSAYLDRDPDVVSHAGNGAGDLLRKYRSR